MINEMNRKEMKSIRGGFWQYAAVAFGGFVVGIGIQAGKNAVKGKKCC
jgi:lactobin A/cerein 7B family class IIb bacteriocin